jgi:hypothetical protein
MNIKILNQDPLSIKRGFPSKVMYNEEVWQGNNYIHINHNRYRINEDATLTLVNQPIGDGGQSLVKASNNKQQELRNQGFINETDLVFSDISSEVDRQYTFPNGNKLLIKNPLKLHVSKSGGHRIWDVAGKCYYVQPREGWYIEWQVKEGEPNFVK